MAKHYKSKFRCAACETLHSDEWLASRCCQPEEVFVCELCEEEHWAESLAEKCCIEEETEELKIPLAYLERHGQQRLF